MSNVFKPLLAYVLMVLCILAFPVAGPNIVGVVAFGLSILLLLSLFLPEVEGYKAAIVASRKVAKQSMFSTVLASVINQVGILTLYYLLYINVHTSPHLEWELISVLVLMISHSIASGKLQSVKARLISLKY